MLKQGELVALDDKATLLKAESARALSLKLSPDVLPAALQPMLIDQQDGAYVLKLDDCGALEPILEILREAGVAVRDIGIQKPDLETIFLEVMGRKAQ